MFTFYQTLIDAPNVLWNVGHLPWGRRKELPILSHLTIDVMENGQSIIICSSRGTPVLALPDPEFCPFDADTEGIRIFMNYSLPF